MDPVTFALMMQAAGGGDAVETMTAGNYAGVAFGYMGAAQAAYSGIPPFGVVSGAATAFGQLEALYVETLTPATGLTLSSPAGTPSTITIDGVPYPLTFEGDSDGFYVYSIDSPPVIANGVTYHWVLS